MSVVRGGVRKSDYQFLRNIQPRCRKEVMYVYKKRVLVLTSKSSLGSADKAGMDNLLFGRTQLTNDSYIIVHRPPYHLP